MTEPLRVAPTIEQAKALYDEGLVAFRRGDKQKSRRLNEESLAISRSLSDKANVVLALMGLSRIALRDGDYTTVRTLCEESLAIADELQDKQVRMLPLHILAGVARLSGDFDRAEELYDESLQLNRQLDNQRMIGVEYHNKAYVALHRNDYRHAAGLFTDSAKIFQRWGTTQSLAFSIVGFGSLAAAEGRLERACRLLGAAKSELDRLGVWLDPTDQPEYDRSIAIARAGLGEATFERTFSEGKGMAIEQAVAQVLESAQG